MPLRAFCVEFLCDLMQTTNFGCQHSGAAGMAVYNWSAETLLAQRSLTPATPSVVLSLERQGGMLCSPGSLASYHRLQPCTVLTSGSNHRVQLLLYHETHLSHSFTCRKLGMSYLAAPCNQPYQNMLQ